jgi:hypothetical protein
MQSHVPQTLTLAGRVRFANTDMMGVALFTKAQPKAPYLWRTVLSFEENMKDPEALNPVANTTADPPLPAILRQGFTLMHLSTCSNAVFLVPNTLLFPTETLLAVHWRCTLLDSQVLGSQFDRLVCFAYDTFYYGKPASDPFPMPSIDSMVQRMMPCYRVDAFRVGMPHPSLLLNPFVFTETSHLDAMAIVAQSSNATRSSSSSAAVASSGPELGPLPVSAVSGMPQLMEPIREVFPFAVDAPDSNVFKEEDFTYHMLCDLAETMGLDGRYVHAAGLRGAAARNTLVSQLLCELLIVTLKYRRPTAFIDHMLNRAITSIMYWVLAVRATDHPLCYSDAHGSTLRAQLYDLAYGFFGNKKNSAAIRFLPRGIPAEIFNVINFWSDFFSACSVSRFLYLWLEDEAVDVPSLELQQVLVDTFLAIVREMVPERLHKLYRKCVDEDGAVPDADQFANDPRFGFHKSALRLYLDKLVDKTRTRPTRRERAKRTAEIESNMQTRIQQQILSGTGSDILDIDDLMPDPENMGGGGGFNKTGAANKDDDEPVHDESYYARRGAHGNGHLFLKAVATDSPFGDSGGRMWKWCAREAENKLSPIVIDQDPAGRANMDLRVMAYHDFMALEHLREHFVRMGKRFYKERDALRSRIAANREHVFKSKSTIELSDGSKLTLSDEQMALFDQITETPITAIKGGGGTGKSTLIAALLTVFSGSTARPAEQTKPAGPPPPVDNQNPAQRGPPRNPLIDWLHETPVALVMAYGKVASNFMRKYGMFASTVHLAAAHLNKDFYHDDRVVEPPCPSDAQATVVIIDEITVQSLTHMTMLTEAFPNMMKLIVVGDINQMSCIERGAVGDALVRLTDEYAGMSVRLTHNYRLTNQSGDDTQLEARTHIAFNAIIAGSVVNGDKRIFGPYSDTGRAADLPAICELSSWDPALVKRALKRAPLLLLPHVDLNKGALGSLKATCDALLQVVGTKPSDWDRVQVLSQRRREEVGPITAHLSEKLFGQDLPKTRQGFLPPSDLCPGEKAVFKRRVKALAPNGSPCYIYTNDMRVIERIEDADEVVLNAKDKQRRQTVYRNQAVRKSTRAYVQGAPAHPNRVRIITFKDGYRVVVPYKTPVSYQDIDFLRRGLCVTNASMQGSAAELVVTYIRPEVSHTLDRRQMYTSVSRMEQNCIIIGSRETLEKVVRQAPQARNDHCIEFLRSAFDAWKEMQNAEAPVEVENV